MGADDQWRRHPELFVLPVTVLLTRTVCVLSRQVRAGAIAALNAGYTAQARRLGVPAARLVLRHALSDQNRRTTRSPVLIAEAWHDRGPGAEWARGRKKVSP
ncbi:hypothetical protein GCM10009680_65020 [Streptomyces yatensis]|uniref:Uncharacterized protein n=1 Tax=Streptomyces yatensis TaxID=155177 RepID=A0ABN2J053_9ACTN